MDVEIPVTSRERVTIPNVRAFDEHSGEPQDPTTLPVKFALVAEDTEPLDDSGYVAGEWLVGAASPTAAIVIGPGGALIPPGAGVYHLWMGIDGTIERPRRRVARVLVS